MTDTTKITVAEALAIHPLAPCVFAQLGGCDTDTIGSAIDAANNGADGGFHGFVYTADCVEFVRKNKSEIRTALWEIARGISGDSHICVMVQQFRCLGSAYSLVAIDSCLYLDGSHAGDDAGMIYSALAWFALETVGHEIIRSLEDPTNDPDEIDWK